MAGTDSIYDIVLFGATGYTGQYTAEHIVGNFPTDLPWAVAGRSRGKLEALVRDLKKLNPDRKPPAIEIAELESTQLLALVRKSKVILNTVGPYAKYGEPVVKACAEAGTHYLDVTGESPWVKEMVDKYNATAKKTGAIIIPQIGVESAPAEMVTYALVSCLRNSAKVFTRDAIVSLHKIKGGPSGGTLATVLSIFDKYSIADIARGSSAQGMTSRTLTARPSPSLFTRLLGVTSVSGLGTLTTSLQAAADLPIVHRSWDLLYDTEEAYGPQFRFKPYMRVRNSFMGALLHLLLLVAPLALLIPPVRWLLAKVVYQPGQGPSREESENHFVEYRGVAIADTNARQRAFASMAFPGSLYHLTGIFLAEGARTVLSGKEIMARKLGGGLLTPATLGQVYIDMLGKAGVTIETKMLAES